MGQERLESRMQAIQNLLSHLQAEMATLETGYAQVLLVLEKMRSLETRAERDDLTGLLRRNAFFSRWNEMLAECERLQSECGVLMIDIDHFKRINDELGHPTGDEVIRAVAQLIQEFTTDGTVLAARYGGEEFAVVIQGDARRVAEIGGQIRERAERLQGISGGQRWRCTVSVGSAMCRADKSSGLSTDASTADVMQTAVAQADQALYAAKKAGRNRLHAA